MTLQRLIDRVIKNFNTGGWTPCPLCKEEWNKLHPCSYLNDGKTTGTYVCMRCAESVQSVEKIFEIIGVNGVYFHPRKYKKPYDDLSRSYGDEFSNPYNYEITVENMNPVMTVTLIPEGGRVTFRHKETSSTTSFANMFQCASYFKALIEQESKRKNFENKVGKWKKRSESETEDQ